MILNAAQGERRKTPPRGMAHENLAAGRRGHAASLKWLAAGRAGIGKMPEMSFRAKLYNSRAARSPADRADRIVFNSDRETVVSPLDKAGAFGEVEHGCKAVNKDAVKWRNQKRELKMGFLVPICMLAMIVICAATLTRL